MIARLLAMLCYAYCRFSHASGCCHEADMLQATRADAATATLLPQPLLSAEFSDIFR